MTRPGRRTWLLPLAALMLLALAGCAAGANPQESVPDGSGDVGGFWLGLWQGLIAPIAFVISLFRDTVSVYEIHNNGNFYDFGFILGVMSSLGGGGAGAARKRASG